MGTRALTIVYDNVYNEPIVNIYTHWDGGPNWYGKVLAQVLNNRVLVDGIDNQCPSVASNGMGCLAATIVASLKTGIGGYYLLPVSVVDVDQEYEYYVYADQVVVKRCIDNINIFQGTWQDFVKFCESH